MEDGDDDSGELALLGFAGSLARRSRVVWAVQAVAGLDQTLVGRRRRGLLPSVSLWVVCVPFLDDEMRPAVEYAGCQARILATVSQIITKMYNTPLINTTEYAAI